MVIRETLSMANFLHSVETCKPFVSEVGMVQTQDDTSAEDSISATLPSDTMLQPSISSITSDGNTSTDERICEHDGNSRGLRILTSIRSIHSSDARVASVDSGRSEDDDGYCSRSSLDSPIQILKQDSLATACEDADVFESGHSVDASGRVVNTSNVNMCVASETGQLIHITQNADAAYSADGDACPAATVASHDHSYLLVASADTSTSQSIEANEPGDLISVEKGSRKRIYSKANVSQATAVLGGMTRNLPHNRRNFSVYVVPRTIRSTPATGRCEARLVQMTCPVETSHSRWNERSSNCGDHNDAFRSMAKKELVTGLFDRPGTLSWHLTDSQLSSVPASIHENLAGDDTGSIGNCTTSAKTSVAHRQDHFKFGVTTGRCRISLTEMNRSLGAVALQKGATSARTGSMYVRTNQSARGSSSSGVHSRSVNRLGGETSLHLHPLVDHDYGAFATFSAEIQSSIISTTTDGASQMDWRSVRKNRINRVRNYRPEMVVTAQVNETLTGSVTETPTTTFQVRQKRKYCRRQPVLRDVMNPSLPKPARNAKVPGRKGRPPLSDARRLSVAKKRMTNAKESSAGTCSASQSFVKIPGCYQDEFVYYATKRTRGRPRKQTDSTNSFPITVESTTATSKPPVSAGGINVFDWYREMAHTDKSSRFGNSTSTSTSPVPGTVHWTSADSGTPADESAVADLVMEMLPRTDLGLEKDFHSVPLSCGSDFPAAAGSFTIAGDRTEMPVTEEEVCAAMLQSLNEADLKMIETQLGVSSDSDARRSPLLSSDTTVEDKTLPPVGGIVALSPYLSDYGRESLLSLSQTSIVSTSNGLLDVDEINDSDLLSADLGNMNVLLNDLSTPTRDVRVNNMPATSRSNLSALFDMPQINATEHDSVTASCAEQADALKSRSSPVASPPELTTVNMFWNDLPGLLIDGLEYIRLVDIHRQMLPAKDTGILKKRCQMLGLNVRQCTELQRDFLIRYMNAAKSKSTVIISRSHAIELIGFYVNPKSKTLRNDDTELDSAAATNVIVQDKVDPLPSSQVDARHSLVENTAATPVISGEESSPPTTATGHSESTSSLPLGSTSPADSLLNVKRSERLRDKHVRYADMVLGIHHRHGLETDAENADTNSAGFRPKRAAELEWSSSRAKCRRTSGDVKMEHEDQLKVGRVRTSSDSSRPVCLVQHSHRTRLASSSEDSVALHVNVTVAGAHLKTVISPRQHHEPHPMPVHVTANRSDSVMSLSCSGAETLASVSSAITQESRRTTILQRTNRMRARRRGRIASLTKRFKRNNVTVANCSTISSKCESATILTSMCEDYKENMNAEGYVVDNMYDNKMKRDTAETVASTSDRSGAGDLASSNLEEDEAMKLSVIDTADDCGADLQTPCEPEVVIPAVERTPVVSSSLVCVMFQTKGDVSRPLCNVVEVRHCDVASRFGRRRRSQNGCILLDRFTASDAECVRCDTCRELFTVTSFVKHMHVGSDVDKLAVVNTLQRLEPRGPGEQEWQVFQRLWTSFVDSQSVNAENADCESSPTSDDHIESSLPGDVPAVAVTDERLPTVAVQCQDVTEDDLHIQSNASHDNGSLMAEKSAYVAEHSTRRVTRSIEKTTVYPESAALRHHNIKVGDLQTDDQMGEPLTRRSTRSSDFDAPVKVKIGRSSLSTETCCKTQTSLSRHSERAMHRRNCPLADLKQDIVQHETRGHSRQNYRLRSPSGAMASKC